MGFQSAGSAQQENLPPTSGRPGSESVIFQQQATPQPMLIFQNGPVTRAGAGVSGRMEHTGQVVVIEGVVAEPSVHVIILIILNIYEFDVVA